MRFICRVLPACAFLICAVFMYTGCTSSQKVQGDAYRSDEDSAAEGAAGMADSGVAASKVKRARAVNKKEYARPAAAPTPGAGAPQSRTDASVQEDRSTAGERVDSRMIVYTASYLMVVDSVVSSLEAAHAVVDRYQGYIQSSVTADNYRYGKIILRIPVEKFEDAIKDIAKLGEVTSKTISASDVTMEYNDVVLRMQSALEVRARMMELLKRVQKPEEKVKVLKEIARLTQVIDSLNAQKSYLMNKASYSTIEVEFRARLKDTVSHYIASPFGWIRALSISSRSIKNTEPPCEFDVPENFFIYRGNFFKKGSLFLMATPGETVKMRMGFVDNYPAADAEFWKEALALDFTNRRYGSVAQKELKIADGKTAVMTTAIAEGATYYIVAVVIYKDKLAVCEAVFKDKDAYDKYSASVEKFVTSMRFSK